MVIARNRALQTLCHRILVSNEDEVVIEIQNVQECDATDDDSSNNARTLLRIYPSLQLWLSKEKCYGPPTHENATAGKANLPLQTNIPAIAAER